MILTPPKPMNNELISGMKNIIFVVYDACSRANKN